MPRRRAFAAPRFLISSLLLPLSRTPSFHFDACRLRLPAASFERDAAIAAITLAALPTCHVSPCCCGVATPYAYDDAAIDYAMLR